MKEFFVSLSRWVGWLVFYRRAPVTVINDCRDENARGRQLARLAALFPGSHISFVGVENDVEAGLHLVDVIDSLDGKPGIILVNVAPRNGQGKKWENGVPFGAIKYSQAVVFTTISQATLSPLAKVAPPSTTIRIFDLPKVIPRLTADPARQEHIRTSQFRSYEFLPRLAAAYLRGISLPAEIKPLMNLAQGDQMVIAYIDCFGNAKTTIFPEEIGFKPDIEIRLQIGDSPQAIRCYHRLKDIPDNVLGLVIGSSGLGQQRFLEIMVQGGSAGALLKARIGSELKLAG